MKSSMMWLALVMGFLTLTPAWGEEAPPPPSAPAEAPPPKPLEPGLLSLDSTVGVLDKAIDDGRSAVEKALGIGISGFFDMGYTWSSNHPGRSFKHPLDPSSQSISGRYFDQDHNRFIFNDFNLTLDKPEKDWGIGFHVVGDFGRTAELLREATLWSSKLHEQPSAELREAFFTFTIPVGEGLQVKGGKFVTPMGTETLLAPGAYNENISRSFAFNFAVPLTHTGAQFTYPFSKIFSVNAGPVTGWDDPHDSNNAPSFMGGISFTPVDAFALSSNFMAGREWTSKGTGNPNHDGGTRVLWSNVATIKPVDPLTLYLEYTMGHEEKALTPTAIQGAWWHALAGIASYAWTDRFTTALRGEVFLDNEAARTGGLDAITCVGAKCVGKALKSVTLGEMTLTAAYKFTAKLLGRFEVREDGADKKVFAIGNTGTNKSQTTLALQAIYGF